MSAAVFAAFVAVVAGATAISVPNSPETPLVLLQVHAKETESSYSKLRKPDELIPKEEAEDYAAEERRPERLFASISAASRELQARMTQDQQSSTAKLARGRARYEAKLDERDQENRKIQKQNEELRSRITSQRAATEEVRQRAKAIQQECRHLLRATEGLQVNLTSAEAYSRVALEAAMRVDEAKELEILREMRDQEALDQRYAQRSLEEAEVLGEASEPVASLLQMDSSEGLEAEQAADATAAAAPDEAARQLLQTLQDSAAALEREQKAAEDELRESYEKELKPREAKHKALLEERAQLHSELSEEEARTRRAQAAEEHLTKVRKRLQGSRAGLLSYVKRIGDAPLKGRH
eukprot:TRINITY_DN54498_c0_g1_i1.p1 TRINITY_DN54498_c0_g1~~TRINITY_DN54498_c0_g1_i1.p1  ORF type:complete len:353 (+),score=96.12 TRINITY_DN54498_c0_g1_i1:121-1179(+)